MDNYNVENEFGTGSAKCPNCAASIFYNEKAGKLVCNMCGSLFDPESLKPLGRIENRDTDAADEKEDNKQEFICDSCGAAVVTDYNTSATFCAFCGSPTLIKRRLSTVFRPDLIIPFKIGQEEAIANYLEWAKKQKNVPKKFTSKAVLSKITGYYVPFWLLDADCIADVRGKGQKFQGEKIENYDINRTLNYKVRRVPFDGCRSISNTLMEAIEPFDYKDLKEYHDMYLPGFFANRYDLSAIDMIDVIKIRLDNYASEIVKSFSTSDYDECKAIGVSGSYSDNFKQAYALMPVWFLNIEYEGSTYGIAVNGQTGKASGSLPINKKSVYSHAAPKLIIDIMKYLGLTLILPAISVISVAFLLGERANFLACLIVFLLIWIPVFSLGLIAFIPFIRQKFNNMRFYGSVTIDKAPDIAQYIDLKNSVAMENRDSFAYMSAKADDEASKNIAQRPLSERILSNIFKS